MSEDEEAEKQWAELRPELRKAIIAAGRRRLFWRQVREMLGEVKGLATALLTLAALWVLFRDSFFAWVAEAMGGAGK